MQTLVIDRSTTNITVVKDDSVIEAARRVNQSPIYGIVGIMNIMQMNYLGVIENAEHVGTLNNAKIYKITNVNMIPFRVSYRTAILSALKKSPFSIINSFVYLRTVRSITAILAHGQRCEDIP